LHKIYKEYNDEKSKTSIGPVIFEKKEQKKKEAKYPQ
jgi:hypothetical protein